VQTYIMAVYGRMKTECLFCLNPTHPSHGHNRHTRYPNILINTTEKNNILKHIYLSVYGGMKTGCLGCRVCLVCLNPTHPFHGHNRLTRHPNILINTTEKIIYYKYLYSCRRRDENRVSGVSGVSGGQVTFFSFLFFSSF
jgi:hypothetical protein